MHQPESHFNPQLNLERLVKKSQDPKMKPCLTLSRHWESDSQAHCGASTQEEKGSSGFIGVPAWEWEGVTKERGK